MVNSFLKRVISSITLLAFLCMDEGSLFASTLAPQTHVTDVPLQLSSDIFIPKELASVVEKYEALGAHHTVILFQDVHAQREAQKSSAATLDYLAQKYGLRLVGMEAASGAVDVASFRDFRDKNILKNVTEKYLGRGELSGAEFQAINGAQTFELYGIENLEAYLKNYHAYRDSFALRQELKEKIQGLKDFLSRIQEYVYSSSVQAFAKKFQDYGEHKINLEKFIPFLMSEAQNAGVRSDSSSLLTLYLKVLDAKKKVDFKALHDEMAQLLVSLQGKVDEDELSKFLELTLTYRLNEISPLEFYQTVKRLMDNSRLTTHDSQLPYPNIQHYMEYLELDLQVNDLRLFDEIRSLSEKVLIAKCQTDEEKLLCRYEMFVSMLTRVADLALSKSEYATYVAGHGKLIPEMIHFIRKEADEYLMDQNLEALNYPFEEKLSKVETYYQAALERDEEMKARLIDRLKNEKSEVSALIAGGFHTQSLTQALKDAGYSYQVVIPTFDATKPDHYQDVMMGKKTPFEKWLYDNVIQLTPPTPLTLRGEKNTDVHFEVSGGRGRVSNRSFLTKGASHVTRDGLLMTPSMLVRYGDEEVDAQGYLRELCMHLEMLAGLIKARFTDEGEALDLERLRSDLAFSSPSSESLVFPSLDGRGKGRVVSNPPPNLSSSSSSPSNLSSSSFSPLNLRGARGVIHPLAILDFTHLSLRTSGASRQILVPIRNSNRVLVLDPAGFIVEENGDFKGLAVELLTQLKSRIFRRRSAVLGLGLLGLIAVNVVRAEGLPSAPPSGTVQKIGGESEGAADQLVNERADLAKIERILRATGLKQSDYDSAISKLRDLVNNHSEIITASTLDALLSMPPDVLKKTDSPYFTEFFKNILQRRQDFANEALLQKLLSNYDKGLNEKKVEEEPYLEVDIRSMWAYTIHILGEIKPDLIVDGTLPYFMKSIPPSVLGSGFVQRQFYFSPAFTRLTENRSDEVKYSLSLSAYLFLTRGGYPLNENNIEKMVQFLIEKRERMAEDVVLGPAHTVIGVVNNTVGAGAEYVIENLAGWAKVPHNSVHSFRVSPLWWDLISTKMWLANQIIKNQGPLFVNLYFHGNDHELEVGVYEGLLGGVKAVYLTDQELAEALKAREKSGKRVDEVVFFLNACEGRFGANLEMDLSRLGVKTYPKILQAAHYDSFASSGVFSVPFHEISVKHPDIDGLKVKYVYEAAEYAFQQGEDYLFLVSVPEADVDRLKASLTQDPVPASSVTLPFFPTVPPALPDGVIELGSLVLPSVKSTPTQTTSLASRISSPLGMALLSQPLILLLTTLPAAARGLGEGIFKDGSFMTSLSPLEIFLSWWPLVILGGSIGAVMFYRYYRPQLKEISERVGRWKSQLTFGSPLADLGKCVTADTLLPILRKRGAIGLDLGEKEETELYYSEVIPIVQVRSGDYVYSLNEGTGQVEPHRIVGLLDMGIKPVFKLTTESGRSIKTTANHPYLKKLGAEGWGLGAKNKLGAGRSNQVDTARDHFLHLREQTEVFRPRDTGNFQIVQDDKDGNGLVAWNDQRTKCAWLCINPVIPFFSGELKSSPFEDTAEHLIGNRCDFRIHVDASESDLTMFSDDQGRRDPFFSGRIFLYESIFTENILKGAHAFAFLEEKSDGFLASFPGFVHAIPATGDRKLRAKANVGLPLFKHQQSEIKSHHGSIVAHPSEKIKRQSRRIKTTANHPYLNKMDRGSWILDCVSTYFPSSIIHHPSSFSKWTKVSALQVGDEIAVSKEKLPSSISVLSSVNAINDNFCEFNVKENAIFTEFGSHSNILWDPIVSIESVGFEHVYDIEVEGTHNFVGNGIFAHNTAIFATPTPQTLSQATSNIVGEKLLDEFEKLNGDRPLQEISISEKSGQVLEPLRQALEGHEDAKYMMVRIDVELSQGVVNHVIVIDTVENLRRDVLQLTQGSLDLARISHHISAASANSASSASSDSVGHAQHIAKYASHGLGRLPRIQGRPDALATKSDEKCGLEGFEFILNYSEHGAREEQGVGETLVFLHNITLGTSGQSLLRGRGLMSSVISQWARYLAESTLSGRLTLATDAKHPATISLFKKHFLAHAPSDLEKISLKDRFKVDVEYTTVHPLFGSLPIGLRDAQRPVKIKSLGEIKLVNGTYEVEIPSGVLPENQEGRIVTEINETLRDVSDWLKQSTLSRISGFRMPETLDLSVASFFESLAGSTPERGEQRAGLILARELLAIQDPQGRRQLMRLAILHELASLIWPSLIWPEHRRGRSGDILMEVDAHYLADMMSGESGDASIQAIHGVLSSYAEGQTIVRDRVYASKNPIDVAIYDYYQFTQLVREFRSQIISNQPVPELISYARFMTSRRKDMDARSVVDERVERIKTGQNLSSDDPSRIKDRLNALVRELESDDALALLDRKLEVGDDVVNFYWRGTGDEETIGLKQANDEIWGYGLTNQLISVVQKGALTLMEESGLVELTLETDDKGVLHIKNGRDLIRKNYKSTVFRVAQDRRVGDYELRLGNIQLQLNDALNRYVRGEETALLGKPDEAIVSRFHQSVRDPKKKIQIDFGIGTVRGGDLRSKVEADSEAIKAAIMAHHSEARRFDQETFEAGIEEAVKIKNILIEARFSLFTASGELDSDTFDHLRKWEKFEKSQHDTWSGVLGQSSMTLTDVQSSVSEGMSYPEFLESRNASGLLQNHLLRKLYHYHLAKHFFEWVGIVDYIKEWQSDALKAQERSRQVNDALKYIQENRSEYEKIIGKLSEGVPSLETHEASLRESMEEKIRLAQSLLSSDRKIPGCTSRRVFDARAFSHSEKGMVFINLDVKGMGRENFKDFLKRVEKIHELIQQKKSNPSLTETVNEQILSQTLIAGDTVTENFVKVGKKAVGVIAERLKERPDLLNQMGIFLNSDGSIDEEKTLNLVEVGGDELTFAIPQEALQLIGEEGLSQIQVEAGTRMMVSPVEKERVDRRDEVNYGLAIAKLDEGTALAKELEALGFKDFFVRRLFDETTKEYFWKAFFRNAEGNIEEREMGWRPDMARGDVGHGMLAMRPYQITRFQEHLRSPRTPMFDAAQYLKGLLSDSGYSSSVVSLSSEDFRSLMMEIENGIFQAGYFVPGFDFGDEDRLRQLKSLKSEVVRVRGVNRNLPPEGVEVKNIEAAIDQLVNDIVQHPEVNLLIITGVPGAGKGVFSKALRQRLESTLQSIGSDRTVQLIERDKCFSPSGGWYRAEEEYDPDTIYDVEGPVFAGEMIEEFRTHMVNGVPPLRAEQIRRIGIFAPIDQIRGQLAERGRTLEVDHTTDVQLAAELDTRFDYWYFGEDFSKYTLMVDNTRASGSTGESGHEGGSGAETLGETLSRGIPTETVAGAHPVSTPQNRGASSKLNLSASTPAIPKEARHGKPGKEPQKGFAMIETFVRALSGGSAVMFFVFLGCFGSALSVLVGGRSNMPTNTNIEDITFQNRGASSKRGSISLDERGGVRPLTRTTTIGRLGSRSWLNLANAILSLLYSGLSSIWKTINASFGTFPANLSSLNMSLLHSVVSSMVLWVKLSSRIIIHPLLNVSVSVEAPVDFKILFSNRQGFVQVNQPHGRFFDGTARPVQVTMGEIVRRVITNDWLPTVPTPILQLYHKFHDLLSKSLVPMSQSAIPGQEVDHEAANLSHPLSLSHAPGYVNEAGRDLLTSTSTKAAGGTHPLSSNRVTEILGKMKERGIQGRVIARDDSRFKGIESKTDDFLRPLGLAGEGNKGLESMTVFDEVDLSYTSTDGTEVHVSLKKGDSVFTVTETQKGESRTTQIVAFRDDEGGVYTTARFWDQASDEAWVELCVHEISEVNAKTNQKIISALNQIQVDSTGPDARVEFFKRFYVSLTIQNNQITSLKSSNESDPAHVLAEFLEVVRTLQVLRQPITTENVLRTVSVLDQNIGGLSQGLSKNPLVGQEPTHRFSNSNAEFVDSEKLKRLRGLAELFYEAYTDAFEANRLSQGEAKWTEKDIFITDPLTNQKMTIQDLENIELQLSVGEKKTEAIQGEYRPYRRRIANLKGVKRLSLQDAYGPMLRKVQSELSQGKQSVVLRIGGRSGTGKTSIADEMGKWGLGPILPSEISVLHADDLVGFDSMRLAVEVEKKKGKKLIILEGTYSLRGREMIFEENAPEIEADVQVFVELHEDTRVQRLFERAHFRDRSWIAYMDRVIKDREDILRVASRYLPESLEKRIVDTVQQVDGEKNVAKAGGYYKAAKKLLLEHLLAVRTQGANSMFDFARVENLIDRYTIDQERRTADIIIKNDQYNTGLGVLADNQSLIFRDSLKRLSSLLPSIQKNKDEIVTLIITLVRDFSSNPIILGIEDLFQQEGTTQRLTTMKTDPLRKWVEKFLILPAHVSQLSRLVRTSLRETSRNPSFLHSTLGDKPRDEVKRWIDQNADFVERYAPIRRGLSQFMRRYSLGAANILGGLSVGFSRETWYRIFAIGFVGSLISGMAAFVLSLSSDRLGFAILSGLAITLLTSVVVDDMAMSFAEAHYVVTSENYLAGKGREESLNGKELSEAEYRKTPEYKAHHDFAMNIALIGLITFVAGVIFTQVTGFSFTFPLFILLEVVSIVVPSLIHAIHDIRFWFGHEELTLHSAGNVSLQDLTPNRLLQKYLDEGTMLQITLVNGAGIRVLFGQIEKIEVSGYSPVFYLKGSLLPVPIQDNVKVKPVTKAEIYKSVRKSLGELAGESYFGKKFLKTLIEIPDAINKFLSGVDSHGQLELKERFPTAAQSYQGALAACFSEKGSTKLAYLLMRQYKLPDDLRKRDSIPFLFDEKLSETGGLSKWVEDVFVLEGEAFETLINQQYESSVRYIGGVSAMKMDDFIRDVEGDKSKFKMSLIHALVVSYKDLEGRMPIETFKTLLVRVVMEAYTESHLKNAHHALTIGLGLLREMKSPKTFFRVLYHEFGHNLLEMVHYLEYKTFLEKAQNELISDLMMCSVQGEGVHDIREAIGFLQYASAGMTADVNRGQAFSPHDLARAQLMKLFNRIGEANERRAKQGLPAVRLNFKELLFSALELGFDEKGDFSQWFNQVIQKALRPQKTFVLEGGVTVFSQQQLMTRWDKFKRIALLSLYGLIPVVVLPIIILYRLRILKKSFLQNFVHWMRAFIGKRGQVNSLDWLPGELEHLDVSRGVRLSEVTAKRIGTRANEKDVKWDRSNEVDITNEVQASLIEVIQVVLGNAHVDEDATRAPPGLERHSTYEQILRNVSEALERGKIRIVYADFDNDDVEATRVFEDGVLTVVINRKALDLEIILSYVAHEFGEEKAGLLHPEVASGLEPFIRWRLSGGKDFIPRRIERAVGLAVLKALNGDMTAQQYLEDFLNGYQYDREKYGREGEEVANEFSREVRGCCEDAIVRDIRELTQSGSLSILRNIPGGLFKLLIDVVNSSAHYKGESELIELRDKMLQERGVDLNKPPSGAARYADVSDAVKILAGDILRDPKQITLISGIPGSGKTTFGQRLTEELRSRSSYFRVELIETDNIHSSLEYEEGVIYIIEGSALQQSNFQEYIGSSILKHASHSSFRRVGMYAPVEAVKTRIQGRSRDKMDIDLYWQAYDRMLYWYLAEDFSQYQMVVLNYSLGKEGLQELEKAGYPILRSIDDQSLPPLRPGQDRYKVITVCRANIFRSQMLQLFLQKMFEKLGFGSLFEVSSRGFTEHIYRDPWRTLYKEYIPTRERVYSSLVDRGGPGRRAADEYYFLKERAEFLGDADIQSASLILVADQNIKDRLSEKNPDLGDRVRLMTDLFPEGHDLYGKDLPDLPVNGPAVGIPSLNGAQLWKLLEVVISNYQKAFVQRIDPFFSAFQKFLRLKLKPTQAGEKPRLIIMDAGILQGEGNVERMKVTLRALRDEIERSQDQNLKVWITGLDAQGAALNLFSEFKEEKWFKFMDLTRGDQTLTDLLGEERIDHENVTAAYLDLEEHRAFFKGLTIQKVVVRKPGEGEILSFSAVFMACLADNYDELLAQFDDPEQRAQVEQVIAQVREGNLTALFVKPVRVSDALQGKISAREEAQTNM
ncbi:MAG: hypothetical protein HYZ67_00615 [Chlamydiae bacterium]|nr:hypothetical protein [Chlamydiota bacterium]